MEKEKQDSEENQESGDSTGASILISVVLIVVVSLYVLFRGSPDLHDTIMYRLLDGNEIEQSLLW